MGLLGVVGRERERSRMAVLKNPKVLNMFLSWQEN
jgi:hypothetical protein